MSKISVVFWCLMGLLSFSAQANKKSDSLNYEINNAPNAIVKADLQLDYYYELKYEKLDECITETKKAFEILKNANNKPGIAKSLSYLGLYMLIQDSVPAAIAYLEDAESILLQHRNPKILARVYNNLGVGYSHIMDKERALEYFQKSLHIRETELNNEDIASNLINISSILYDMGRYEECLEINEKALVYNIESGDLETQAVVYSNIGVSHERLGDFRQAVDYTLKALDIYQNKVKNDGATARTLSNLGTNYLNQGMLTEAKYYFNLALELNTKINHQPNIIVCYNNLAEVERKLGNFHEAENLAETALQKATSQNNLEERKISIHELSLIAEDRGDFENGLKYYKMFINLGDSLSEESESIMIEKALIQNQLTLERIQKEKELENQKITGKKVDVMYSFILVAVIATLVLFYALYGNLKINPLIINSLNFFVPFLVSGTATMFILLKTSIPQQFNVWLNISIVFLIIFLGISIHLFLLKLAKRKMN